MTVHRLILPDWAKAENPSLKKIVEGQFSHDELLEFNEKAYNIYYLPNYPSIYDSTKSVDGSDIDVFEYVFADMDLKDGTYSSKDEFIALVHKLPVQPTKIIDSGRGVHVYWRVSDLDALSFLKLQRRICRHLNTDEAVSKIYQLMRVPGTVNTKEPTNYQICQVLFETNLVYTSEDMDKFLPPLTREDEDYCQQHYESTYNKQSRNVVVKDEIPNKFNALIRENREVKEIWLGNTDDRSASDYRLGHIMYASQFTRDEAISVLVNTSKALARAPIHRLSYATNIVDKIWTFESTPNKNFKQLSSSVKNILSRSTSGLEGTRFPCWTYLDNTVRGFRLGDVIGLVAGSGVGKTAIALNMFKGFVHNNPDYVHFFIPLEQPANEIALRWKSMCGDDTRLHDKVEVLSNYDENGGFRHLSLDEIKDYVLQFQEATGRKVGCVVIDHVGALKKKGKDGENQGLMDICHAMKAFAVETNTLLVMQSQAPREKAGIGDLELNKDAAYGTVYFESYCDFLVTMWQPLKRCYSEPACPTVTAFKFCKIRHKKQGIDKILEDVPYALLFDSKSEQLRELTQDEEKAFDFFNKQATNKRKMDRNSDVVKYTSTKVLTEAS